jgi:hypothetical protein
MSPLIARHGSGAAGAANQPNDLAVAIVAITYWSWAPAVRGVPKRHGRGLRRQYAAILKAS